MTPPLPIDQILTIDELRALRDGYDRNFLTQGARKMIGYEKAQGLADWIGEVVYRMGDPSKVKVSSLAFFEREIVIVTVAAVQRDVFVLSGHFYWLLMELLLGPCANDEPTAVAKLADVVVTVAAYAGVDNFRLSLTVLADVLKVLKACYAEGAVSTKEVLGYLKAAFPPR